jgi:hypothetical protein
VVQTLIDTRLARAKIRVLIANDHHDLGTLGAPISAQLLEVGGRDPNGCFWMA